VVADLSTYATAQTWRLAEVAAARADRVDDTAAWLAAQLRVQHATAVTLSAEAKRTRTNATHAVARRARTAPPADPTRRYPDSGGSGSAPRPCAVTPADVAEELTALRAAAADACRRIDGPRAAADLTWGAMGDPPTRRGRTLREAAPTAAHYVEAWDAA
jgi:hypothetical protein